LIFKWLSFKYSLLSICFLLIFILQMHKIFILLSYWFIYIIVATVFYKIWIVLSPINISKCFKLAFENLFIFACKLTWYFSRLYVFQLSFIIEFFIFLFLSISKGSLFMFIRWGRLFQCWKYTIIVDLAKNW
jgi:hypothetical protein